MPNFVLELTVNRQSVGQYTLTESNKRGDWSKKLVHHLRFRRT